MPRVSAEHLSARREQILDAARVCFMRNGFHQTSIQDVIKEASLSVGAVYRYFPSKTDLMAAIAEQVVDQIVSEFSQLLATDPPPTLVESMERAVDMVTANSGPDGVFRLAVQVWSESTTDPTLAPFVNKVYSRLRESLAGVAEHAIEHGELPPGADPRQIGAVLLALMPGYALQRILTGCPDPDDFKAGLRALLCGSSGTASGPRSHQPGD